eukprot:3949290-Alexandrium_andersonii.AAC.1
MRSSGEFSIVPESFGQLWKALECPGGLWRALGGPGRIQAYCCVLHRAIARKRARRVKARVGAPDSLLGLRRDLVRAAEFQRSPESFGDVWR